MGRLLTLPRCHGNILGRSQGFQGETTTARSQSIQPVFCHVLSQVLQQCTRVLSENCEKYADLLERCAPVTLLWDGSARRFSYKKWWFSIAILNYQAMHGTNSAIYTVLLVILTISLEALVKFSIFTFLKDICCTILDVKYYNLLQVLCAYICMHTLYIFLYSVFSINNSYYIYYSCMITKNVLYLKL